APHASDRARGRAVRKAVPRSAHAEWGVRAERSEPLTLLREQETTRVPELVELRHERMLESPFAFYRGAAIVMAHDLAEGPSTGLQVQACGDAHLENFGGFAAPDRAMVFDINDFDETSQGPFEWDVKRLAASLEIAARSREFDAVTVRSIVAHGVRTYRQAMIGYARMSNLDVWYERFDATAVLTRWRDDVKGRVARRFDHAIAKAQSKDSLAAVSKLTRVVDGRYRIVSDPPIVVPITELVPAIEAEELERWLQERLHRYMESLQHDRRHLLEAYEPVDLARKVVGVGSVGTRCWIALLFGRDESDPLVLQIKEAEASVLERFCGKSRYSNHGERVVEGQRLLQPASDIFLGWFRTEGLDGVTRDFYVRQLWDWKLSASVETMMPEGLTVYAELCGATLAHGHARSGDRYAIAAYLGSSDVFDHAIADFASAYADQNERDYAVAGRELRSSAA
ncbi:MAG TPA: DUF2252 domain-containing protein, partial [Acidimicrobiia bacterium]|nr:DUF2252 domain-containing protein [Acidimicrobiia bacterium]